MVVRYRFRLYLLALVTIGGFAGLLFRLWSIQIDRHEYFSSRVPGTSDLTVRVPGVRGEIKDCNGVTLVTNRPSFEVIFDLKEIYTEYRKQHQAPPKFSYLGRVGGLPKEVEEVDIIEIVNDSVIQRLQELGLAKPYNSDQMRVHYRTSNGVVPYTYRRDLTFEDFARFAEHNLDLPGVSVAARPSREYAYGSLGCHLLGYVRLPDPKQVSAEVRSTFDFYVGDDFGIAGLEKSMDQYLQGKPGKRIMLRNEKGKIVGETGFEPPEAGADVYLTIDANVQYIAEEALRSVGRGAAVVMDPRNGAILAMASVPSFDPNKFIPSIEADHWEEYLGNPTYPLTNRAIQAFAPGSIYKIPISFAGMLSGAHRRNFTCTGFVQYGNRPVKCWIADKGGSHGSIALGNAIKVSCNAFFYQYGNATGINNIATMGKLFSLGEKTGIPLEGEAPGILPSPRWLMMNEPGARWTEALTAFVSIGQGATEVTPLQMASVTSAVANGGMIYKPRLIAKVVSKKGEVILEDEPGLRSDLTKEGISQEDLKIVRHGMWSVVNDVGGTAGAARSKKTVIAGKTGTAQAFRPDGQGDNNAWFIAFAPFDDPVLAVCVMVQNGHSGGSVGAPIARKIIEESLAVEHGYSVPLQVVAEATGDFEKVMSVSFDTHEEMDVTFEDADTGDQVGLSGMMPARGSRSAAVSAPAIQAPSIEPAADAAGSVVPKAIRIFKPKAPSPSPEPEPKRRPFQILRKK